MYPEMDEPISETLGWKGSETDVILTGYRPILDAFKALVPASAPDIEVSS